MGSLLGSGVRFGMQPDNPVSIMVAGEGLETIVSLRMIMPALPMIAALSANHLAAVVFPPVLKRLYIAVDADPAGRHGMERLSRRARSQGIEVLTLMPRRGDFNDDLRHLGPEILAEGLVGQLIPGDATQFLQAA